MNSTRHLPAALAATVTLLTGCYGPLPMPPPPPLPSDVDEHAGRIPGYLKTIKVSAPDLGHEQRQALEAALQSKGWMVVSGSDADAQLVVALDQRTWKENDPYALSSYGGAGHLPPLPDTTTLTLELTALDRGTSFPKTLWQTKRSAQRRHHPAARHSMVREMEEDLLRQTLQQVPARSMPAPSRFQPMESYKVL
ncbi:MAG: hypothetical protein ACO1TE_02750 [Prosthecobacter sp.]